MRTNKKSSHTAGCASASANAPTSTSSHVSLKVFLLTLVVSNLLVIQLCQLQQMVLVDEESSPPTLAFSFLPSSILDVSSSLFQDAVVKFNKDNEKGDDEDDKAMYWLAKEQSFGFFTDISNSDWKRYYQHPTRDEHHAPYRIPNEPNFRSHNVAFWTFFNWDPSFTCPHLVRFAKNNYKAICDPERILDQIQQRQRSIPAGTATDTRNGTTTSHAEPFANSSNNNTGSLPCIIYSFGSSTSSMDRLQEQHGWIADLLDLWAATGTGKTHNDKSNGDNNKNQNLCEIHIFDPFLDRHVGTNTANANVSTITKATHPLLNLPNVHFHPWKLVSSSSKRQDGGGNTDEYSFDDIVTKLRHVNRTLDILHLACQGCEWFTYRDWLSPPAVNVRQVLVETYSLPAAILAVETREAQQSPLTQNERQVLSTMNASDFFDAFRQVNYVLYAKQVQSDFPAIDKGRNCLRTQWSFLKLQSDFFA